MELADQIVVINGGRVEQAGSPGELYDGPVNDFVMEFLGPTTRLGGALVRPHDIEVLHDRTAGTHEAMVERVVDLGFHNRIEVALPDGGSAVVQVTRAEAQHLDLGVGDVVFLRPLTAGAVPRPRRAPAGSPDAHTSRRSSPASPHAPRSPAVPAAARSPRY